MTNEQLKIKIKIINSSKSTENIDWLFKTIKDVIVQNFSLQELLNQSFIINKNELYILNVDSITPNSIESIRSFVEKSNPEIWYIAVHNQLTHTLSPLIRMGIHKIFYLPEEEFILRSSVNEKIDELKKEYEREILKNNINKRYSFENLIGSSQKFLECIEIAKRVAGKSDTNVLIFGETGTGKELLAKAIHYNSPRSSEPFIELNTSAISENLFESELFGYEKGAFTDAKISKPGLLEIAENGTAFLDEIGDLSFNLQVKLLRAIENKSIKRVGGIKDIKINCRIIAATNQNLEQLVQEKKFRSDLYFRLKVISIHLPPLRERPEDIIPLAEHFIDEFNRKYDTKIQGLSRKAKQILLQYSWPGNIRELSNVIERAVLLSNANLISEGDIHLGTSSILSSMKKNLIELKVEIDKASLTKVNRDLAKEILKLVDGNKSQAARILGISRPSLLKILNEEKK